MGRSKTDCLYRANEAHKQLTSLIDLHHKDFKVNGVSDYIQILLKNINDEILKTPPLLIKYEQGTLISVDFGINVGSELSSKHFAIVVNADDKPRSPNVTVVPLTSKGKDYYIDIGSEVFDRSIEHITAVSEDCNRQSEILDKIYAPFLELDKLDSATSEESELIENNFTAALLDYYDEPISVHEFKMLVETDRHAISRKAADKLISSMDHFKDSVQKLGEVIEAYKKYRKNSFADIRQITTISKKRIVSRINRFDPMGTIKVSDPVFQKLKEEINKFLWGS